MVAGIPQALKVLKALMVCAVGCNCLHNYKSKSPLLPSPSIVARIAITKVMVAIIYSNTFNILLILIVMGIIFIYYTCLTKETCSH